MTTKFNLKAVPGKQETIITRVFDAPLELVWKVVTNPDLIPRWWGPKRLTTTVESMDVRPGGIWRFVQRDADGNEFAFQGVYHEVRPLEQLVFTFEFEGAPGHILFETETFEEVDGKTKVTEKSVFQTIDDRDEMLHAGMETGAVESMERLEELLTHTRQLIR